MRLPEFDGRKNVKSFFTMFERAARTLGIEDDSDAMLSCLMGKLKGAALAWVQGVSGDALASMEYEELREALLAHFQQEGLIHVRAL